MTTLQFYKRSWVTERFSDLSKNTVKDGTRTRIHVFIPNTRVLPPYLPLHFLLPFLWWVICSFWTYSSITSTQTQRYVPTPNKRSALYFMPWAMYSACHVFKKHPAHSSLWHLSVLIEKSFLWAFYWLDSEFFKNQECILFSFPSCRTSQMFVELINDMFHFPNLHPGQKFYNGKFYHFELRLILFLTGGNEESREAQWASSQNIWFNIATPRLSSCRILSQGLSFCFCSLLLPNKPPRSVQNGSHYSGSWCWLSAESSAGAVKWSTFMWLRHVGWTSYQLSFKRECGKSQHFQRKKVEAASPFKGQAEK